MSVNRLTAEKGRWGEGKAYADCTEGAKCAEMKKSAPESGPRLRC